MKSVAFTNIIPPCSLHRQALASAVSAALLLNGNALHAANINVTAGAVDQTDNSTCSLIEAIISANTDSNAAEDACIAGNGGDTLILPNGSTFTLTAGPFAVDGDNALPDITSQIEIQGNGAVIERDAGAATRFRLFHVAISGDLTLDNVTLSNGYAFGACTMTRNGCGGGVFNLGALTVTNGTTFSGNDASFFGGGIFNDDGSTATLTDVIMSGNSVGSAGAAIQNIYGSTVTISDSTISGNTAAASGGAIDNNGMLTIDNSTISDNTATNFSGGAIANNGVLILTDSTLSGNTANFSGGGIYNSGTATLTDLTVSDNSITVFNGGGIANTGTLTLTSSTVVDNSGNYGGGVAHALGNMTINNSTISANTAVTRGGGLFSNNSMVSMTINNSTLFGNSSPQGGGLFNLGTATFNLSIIAGSTNGGDCVNSFGAFLVGTFNDNNTLVQDDSCGDSVFIGDPQLEALASNGGPTQTHALTPNSLAIDPNIGPCAASLTTDQRGLSRDSNCDLGAYEYIEPPPAKRLNVAVIGEGELTSSPTGIACPGDCIQTYGHGTLVSLTASPATGYQFDSWGGDCASSPSAESADLVMTTDRLCFVVFTEIPAPITPVGTADPAIVGFTQSSYTVSENAGSISINVNLSGQPDGATSIDYALIEGSATAGSDYQETSGTLNWATEETGNQSFEIPIADDDALEGNETVIISLGNASPTGLGIATNVAVLTIIDDETAPASQPGQVQFSGVNSQRFFSLNIVDGTMLVDVSEAAGELIVSVDRAQDQAGEVSVDFDVIPALANMATSPTDFVFTSGTLRWADQSNGSQSFSLSIVDDLIEETSTETFFIELQNPTNGLLLGSPAVLGVTIIDNDACEAGTKGLAFKDAFMPTTTCFANLLDGIENREPLRLNQSAHHRTVIRIYVGEEHQGQPANILLLGGYRETGTSEFDMYERLAELWTMHPGLELPGALERLAALPAQVDIMIHDGTVDGFPGEFIFYGGYLLEDGTIVFNGDSVQSWVVE